MGRPRQDLIPSARRSVLTEAQRADLLVLPEDEAVLVRHWTLSAGDLRIIVSRRRAINTKIHLLSRLDGAVMTARAERADPFVAVESIIGWNALATEVEEARHLVRPDPLDPVELARSSAPILRQIRPAFIAAFTFGAVPACAPLAHAVDVLP